MAVFILPSLISKVYFSRLTYSIHVRVAAKGVYKESRGGYDVAEVKNKIVCMMKNVVLLD